MERVDTSDALELLEKAEEHVNAVYQSFGELFSHRGDQLAYHSGFRLASEIFHTQIHLREAEVEALGDMLEECVELAAVAVQQHYAMVGNAAQLASQHVMELHHTQLAEAARHAVGEGDVLLKSGGPPPLSSVEVERRLERIHAIQDEEARPTFAIITQLSECLRKHQGNKSLQAYCHLLMLVEILDRSAGSLAKVIGAMRGQ